MNSASRDDIYDESIYDDKTDIKQYFSEKDWLSLSSYEKKRYENLKRNYYYLKSTGLNPKVPSFMVSKNSITPKKSSVMGMAHLKEKMDEMRQEFSLEPSNLHKFKSRIEKNSSYRTQKSFYASDYSSSNSETERESESYISENFTERRPKFPIDMNWSSYKPKNENEFHHSLNVEKKKKISLQTRNSSVRKKGMHKLTERNSPCKRKLSLDPRHHSEEESDTDLEEISRKKERRKKNMQNSAYKEELTLQYFSSSSDGDKDHDTSNESSDYDIKERKEERKKHDIVGKVCAITEKPDIWKKSISAGTKERKENRRNEQTMGNANTKKPVISKKNLSAGKPIFSQPVSQTDLAILEQLEQVCQAKSQTNLSLAEEVCCDVMEAFLNMDT